MSRETVCDRDKRSHICRCRMMQTGLDSIHRLGLILRDPRARDLYLHQSLTLQAHYNKHLQLPVFRP
ncbi:hypothetical protein GCM10007094_16110 [Pseudovibrio japonicus]|uniref:Uncharacterized protein n=1 Tax=Pseudovibrio japonicus TaxID=366534 RepID=A0ABQ3EAA4_9HYPH|nr:hypothetical protein GCM10007094_16110 [Pseudovibrio japonicus]